MGFNEQVWNLCKQIPRGKVTTYKEIAKAMKKYGYKSNACRAVGNALNKNLFAQQVPCHRVVNSNGKIGGFAKGMEKKIEMLEKEGIKIKNNKVQNFENVLYCFYHVFSSSLEEPEEPTTMQAKPPCSSRGLNRCIK